MLFLLDATENSSQWLYKKEDGIRAVSGLSSALSILGSALIILSYLCFHSLRTRARLILVHLALTDMGVGIANLVGIIVNFDQYYIHEHSPDDTFHPKMSIAILCSAQASVAHYCTLSSVLWTSSLAVYMYLLIVNQSQRQMKLLMWFFYVFCYGMPLLVTVWLLCTERLGYSPYNSSGWCSIIMVKPYRKKLFEIDLMSDVAGYNLWIMLTITLIVPLYVSVYCFVRQQVKENTDSKLFWQAMHNIDYKFILIPVMFIFLRIWSLIISILLDYCRVQVPETALKALLYMAGFGDSSQGFFNAILFVAFTHSVRKHLFACLCLKRQIIVNVKPEEKSMHLRTETQHLSSKPITFNSRKYSLVANEEVINSTSEEKTISVIPVSNYSPVSWK